ncbi:MAG: MBL fold metallo-hydrolase [Halobacteriota archaeon]|nr:MBL fold metallo-hydrolase [Halobacteriota archaeon]
MEPEGVFKISDKIFMIKGYNGSRNPWCNTMVIADEEIAVIDPGCGKKELERGFSSLGLRVKDVDLVINTHHHFDHTASSWYIRKRSDCQVIMPEQEGRILEDFEEIKRRYHCIEPPKTVFFKMLLPGYARTIGFKECKVDGVYKDGDVINLGDVKLEAIHAPGHTDGFSCFMDRNSGVIYTADIDLTKFGPFCMGITADVSQFIESINKIRELKPSVVVTGHLPDPVTEGIEDRFKSYAEVLLEREKKILGLLSDKEMRVGDLSERIPIFKEKYWKMISPAISPWLKHMAKCMILKHLEKLEDEGVVTRKHNGSEVYFSLL